MRWAHTNGFSQADDIITLLATAWFFVEPNDTILDFGCGAGGLVYEFRDKGFDARGFDLQDYVQYRTPEDRAYFKFVGEHRSDRSDQRFEAESFRLPYPDATFDVIYSTTVLEHVMDLPPVLAELARVTKPGGVGMHVFPRKESLVEPHIYVPLAGRLKSPRWFKLWARLGVRNEFQEGMAALEVAARNLQYTQTGLNYMTEGELFNLASAHFDGVKSGTHLQNKRRDPQVIWARRLDALKSGKPLRGWAQTQPMGVLIMWRDRRQP